ncbi:GntR family transcriptional regulator, partial [Mesorhizobium sp. M2E.F.Ca.ET.209.01.1.1]|uniref:GntR family transcriptional regulator n=1 Tax=Mesorhizobium sp. M2E.F.Ca.ET.209.01.1.1 TaxID=2500526 RepID=UPI001FEDAE3E
MAGDVGIATFKMMLVNMLEGRFISPYDYEIAERIATGSLAVGERLPPQREIARALGINVTTVTRALSTLQER